MGLNLLKGEGVTGDTKGEERQIAKRIVAIEALKNNLSHLEQTIARLVRWQNLYLRAISETGYLMKSAHLIL